MPRLNKCIKYGQYPGCWGKPDGFRLKGGWICEKGVRFNFCPTTKVSAGTICAPGTCSSYSSASYEVAGLLLAAVGTPGRRYTDMDLGDFVLPERERYPSLAFPPVTSQSQHDVKSSSISQNLTVPGETSGLFGEKGPPSLINTLAYWAGPVATWWVLLEMLPGISTISSILSPRIPS